MCRPTLDVYQWIIIDDGETDSAIPASNTHIRIDHFPGPRKWEPEFNTHRFNMELALSKVEGKYVFIIEDDDYYHPDYLSSVCTLLRDGGMQAVGLANNMYYSVAVPGFKAMQNTRHSSLCSTAFNASLVPLLKTAVNTGEVYFDIEFWKRIGKFAHPAALIFNTNLVIGIKNLPGRDGIGIGHRQKDYHYDTKLTKLKEWLGDDHKFYLPFIRGAANAIKQEGQEDKVSYGKTVRQKERGQRILR
jgi:glycosyltransferase involved in cell wall biosynthesis